MAQSKLYLDTRSVRKDGTSPLKIAITHKRAVALISLDVHLLPQHWDGAQVVKHPQRATLNHHIAARKLRAEAVILELSAAGEIKRMTATQIKERIISEPVQDCGVLFATHFEHCLSKKSNLNTRASYQQTLGHMAQFDRKLRALTFDDITRDWLDQFDAHMATQGLSVNTRAIHMRNTRAVINDALDNDLTSQYAFRRFRIKTQQTAKRSLTVEQLRALIAYPCEEDKVQYRDMFLLSFYLVGINPADLFRLSEGSIVDGRIVYNRAKTNRLYSIKIEPEARELLDRHRGKSALLAGMDRNKSYRNYAARVNQYLKCIGEVKRVGKGGHKIYTPLHPDLSMYLARHTWATIAASLDIPKETIAAALGHGGGTVTDIYIDFDRDKVDAANRRVIDWVFYSRR